MLHIICNPTAGKGRAGRLLGSVRKYLEDKKIAHAFHMTQYDREATDIARRLTKDISEDIDIIAMGGDGTLSEVLNGLEDPSKVRLGLIPCGSGNDFAGMTGIPLNPEGALDIIAGTEAKYTDYLDCCGVRGINAIGMGIDVDILQRRRKMKLLHGPLSYLAALIASVITFDACSFSEETPEGPVPHSALVACAGNGRRIGGGIALCPEARIDDGMLDFVIVDNLKKYQLPRAFMMLMSGKILAHPHTVFRRSDRVTVRSDVPMPIQIDGEIFENLTFDVRIIHNSLRMYRP